MKRIILTITAVFAMGYIVKAQNIIYVDINATGNKDGSSWANAHTNLDSLLEQLPMGPAQIWVAEGTYKPNTNIRSRSFNWGRDSIEIYGGFKGTETLLSQRDFRNNETILSGDIGVPNDKTDNSYTLVSGPEGRDFGMFKFIHKYGILDGFTVRDAYSADRTNGQPDAAAIMLAPYCEKLIVRNCIITDNESRESPILAISATTSSELVLEHCIVKNNKGRRGVGTQIEATNFAMTASINNCLFHNNEIVNLSNFGAGSNGVILVNANAQLTFNLTNSTLAYNKNGGHSSGNSKATIEYYTSSANGSKIIRIDNCILWGNTGDTVGVYRHPNSVGPAGTKIRSCISEKPIYTTAGSIFNLSNSDPQFYNTANHDFSVTTGSPAIDKGTEVADVLIIDKDLAGNARIANGRVDIGCYEFGSTSSNREINKPVVSIYPNPAQNHITINTPEAIKSIRVVDLQGKEVLKINGVKNKLDISELKGGIYIMQIIYANTISYAKLVKD